MIDEDGVITGSYNWTRRASRADENILRVRDDAALAAGYSEAFAQLLDKHRLRPREPALDSRQLLRRLEVVHNLLLLEDFEMLATQVPPTRDWTRLTPWSTPSSLALWLASPSVSMTM